MVYNPFLQILAAGDPGGLDEEAEKEWTHTLLQDSMGKELNELNRRLEEKEVSSNFYVYANLSLLFVLMQHNHLDEFS